MDTRQINRIVEQIHKAVLPSETVEIGDGQLLECFVAGRDEKAFEMLLHRHGPMVLKVCRRVLSNHHDVEDAFQATFLVLARRAAAIRPREMVGNWLYGVAYKTALRAKSVSAKRHIRERQMNPMPDPEMPRRDSWPDLPGVLDEELSRLSDKYRVPIVLCDLQGKSPKEAAQHLGLREGTFSSRLSRGRAMLVKRLARHGFTLSAGAVATHLSQHAVAAQVPAALSSATLKAAVAFAGGHSAANLVSHSVASLTEWVLQSILLTKFFNTTALTSVVLALALAVTGGAVLAWSNLIAPSDNAPVVDSPPKKAELVKDVEAPADRGDPPVAKAGAEPTSGQRLAVEKDFIFQPGLNYASLLILEGSKLTVLTGDGMTAKTYELPKFYRRICERADVFVCLNTGGKAIDIIEKTTLQIKKTITIKPASIPLFRLEDLASHPTRPISFLTINYETTAPGYRVLIVDESNGKVTAPKEMYGTFVSVAANGQLLFVGYRDIARKGFNLPILGGKFLIQSYMGDINTLFSYSLQGDKATPKLKQIMDKVGGNGHGLAVSPDSARVAYLSTVGNPAFSGNLIAYNTKNLLKEAPAIYELKGIGSTSSLSFHPSQKLAAVPGASLVPGTAEPAVILDRESGTVLKNRLKYNRADFRGVTVNKVFFAPDGKHLVLACTDAKSSYLRSLELSDGKTDLQHDKTSTPAPAKGLAGLQGFWIRTKIEDNSGKPGGWYTGSDGIYFEGDKVYWIDKNGRMIFNGPTADVSADVNATPQAVDFDITRGQAKGEKWLAVSRIDGDTLILATNCSDQRRPKTVMAAAYIFTYQRVPDPSAATQPRKAPVLAVNALDGLWIKTGLEDNSARAGSWFTGSEAIRFDGSKVTWVRKDGKPVLNGPAAQAAVDSTQWPMTLDFTLTQGASKGEKWQAIFRIEGDRLIIATNCLPDRRPGVFTSALATGAKRAGYVFTYKRVGS